MINFILVCAGLLLLSGLFYLLPARARHEQGDERDERNLDWYRQRQSELAEQGDSQLLGDVKLRLLEDMPTKAKSPTSSQLSQSTFPRWILLPLVAIASSLLYFMLGSAPDVQINKQLKAINEQTTPEQMQDVMKSIEQRSQQRPDNLHYRGLLGRFYMGQQDYSMAAQTYSSLAQVAPGDDQTLALAAQAEYLSGNRVLTEKAQMLAEQSLAINPGQRTALGLLGMASFEKGQYRAAIGYWERLLAMEPPGSETAVMIAGVVERARGKLGQGGEPPAPVEAEVSTAVSAGVTVHVSLPAGVSIDPSDSVFVLARAANSNSRMPIAVQRLSGADLPLTLRLDDSSSMAGQKLSEAESIVVIVQVSPNGQPGEANASWLGNGGPIKPSLDPEPLMIILQSGS